MSQPLPEKSTAFQAANVIQRLSVPAAGLLLGLAAAGNLLSPYGAFFRYLPGLIALGLLIMLLLKAALYPGALKAELQNPVLAGIAATLPMALVVLSTYLPASSLAARAVCGVGVLGHLGWIIHFTGKHLPSFTVQQAFPSYFVVYVGVAVFSIVAPVYHAAWLGKILFWFGLTAYLLLLPVVGYRAAVIKAVPAPLLPTMAIFAAPASLCLAGYLNSFTERSLLIVWLLTLLAAVMLLAVLCLMPAMLKNNFFPSYAAFTFPLVISAIALKSAAAFFAAAGGGTAVLGWLARFAELTAIIFVIYVLAKYGAFLVRE